MNTFPLPIYPSQLDSIKTKAKALAVLIAEKLDFKPLSAFKRNDYLSTSGCEACSQDEEFVNEMEELYVNIRNVTTSIEQKALRSFEANLKRKLAF